MLWVGYLVVLGGEQDIKKRQESAALPVYIFSENFFERERVVIFESFVMIP